MTEPRIVDAVEAARPDHWIGVSVSHGTVHLWSNIPRKSSDELMEDVKHFGVSPQFIVRLPGTTAPAPATTTDAVAELMAISGESQVEFGHSNDGRIYCGVWAVASGKSGWITGYGDTPQAAAAACLTKIRGAK